MRRAERVWFPSLVAVVLLLARAGWGQAIFITPQTPRATYNFDIGWKFFKEDKAKVPGAEAVGFDDSAWAVVSTPHTFNDVDSYRMIISHSGGDRGAWKGTAWYRKQFKLPAGDAGKKVFIEFEGMRQAGDIFLNGKEVGLSENGVTPYGVEISDAVNFGEQGNLLAVHLDNTTTYKERATGTAFEWNVNDFNPDYGGINRHVFLHVTGPVYQTLPLYDGLKTSGVYVYAENISVADRTAEVHVESQVRNASADRATVQLTGYVVDKGGVVRAKFDAEPLDMVAGEKSIISVDGVLKDAHLWSAADPYLYDVYTTLSVDGKVVDVNKVTTGFRKAEFKGGAGTGGVYINDKFIYLKGFAQRSADDWAGLGGAYPDWMHELTARLIRDCNGNYIRWMHVAPQPVDAEVMDRMGIVQVAPAGDKERDATGRQWEQRLEVMTDTIIALRNHPSILFWEAGNTVISPEHMQQMVALRKQWDPQGGRVMGSRGDSNNAANQATTPIAEFYGVMIGQDPQTDRLGPEGIFRAYSAARRDRAPIIETEDFRDEGARRFWDDYSPPYMGFKKGADDTYNWNSETFALAGVERYRQYWVNRISNPDAARAKWSGYASIYFSDSNADGRQDSSEVCRVSGKVDSMRLPKEIYYAHRVMQSEKPDVHIVGHWSYPAGTKKTVYVVANTQSVELMLNGKSVGKADGPVSVRFDATSKVSGTAPAPDGFVFAFPDVAFEAGKLTAVASNGGREVARHELETAGAAQRIKLTPVVGLGGMQADGADVALIDVEVVDAQGRRCPTDDARVDFTCMGPGIWRGGYNSGKTDSTNNLFLNTECGINRVAVRSTLNAGSILVTATREGLTPGRATIEVNPVVVHDGLMKVE